MSAYTLGQVRSDVTTASWPCIRRQSWAHNTQQAVTTVTALVWLSAVSRSTKQEQGQGVEPVARQTDSGLPAFPLPTEQLVKQETSDMRTSATELTLMLQQRHHTRNNTLNSNKYNNTIIIEPSTQSQSNTKSQGTANMRKCDLA